MQVVASVLPAFDGLARQRVVSRSNVATHSSSRVCATGMVIEARQMTAREMRERRHLRIRKKVSGTEERPRMAVFRSNNHIYVQVIDDTKGHTLAAVSTLSPAVRDALTNNSGANKDAATLVGKAIAEACLSKNIEKVAFDRGGYLYHGRVQALAEAAREAGLQF